MKNKLFLIGNIALLTCTWVLTGDAKRPLRCVWVIAQDAQALIAKAPADEPARMHLCA